MHPAGIAFSLLSFCFLLLADVSRADPAGSGNECQEATGMPLPQPGGRVEILCNDDPYAKCAEQFGPGVVYDRDRRSLKSPGRTRRYGEVRDDACDYEQHKDMALRCRRTCATCCAMRPEDGSWPLKIPPEFSSTAPGEGAGEGKQSVSSMRQMLADFQRTINGMMAKMANVEAKLDRARQTRGGGARSWGVSGFKPKTAIHKQPGNNFFGRDKQFVHRLQHRQD